MPVIKSPTEPGPAADGRRLLGFYDFELDAGSGFESSVRFGEARPWLAACSTENRRPHSNAKLG